MGRARDEKDAAREIEQKERQDGLVCGLTVRLSKLRSLLVLQPRSSPTAASVSA